VAAAERAAALGVRDVQALADLAMLMVDAGREPEAARLAARAVELHADRAEAWAAVGWTAFRSGRFEDAEAPFEKAVELAPDAPANRNHLALVRIQQRRYGEALSELDRALAAAPDFEPARQNRALALRLSGNERDGIDLHRRLLEEDLARADALLARDPHDPQARTGRIRALVDLRRDDEARAALAEAKSEAADPSQLVDLAAAEAELGDVDAAWETIERAGTEPQSRWHLYTRAWIAALHDDAAAAGEAAAALDDDERPADVRATAACGFAAFTAGDLESASSAFTEALERSPHHCCSHVWLGLANARAGSLEQAACALRDGQRAQPCRCPAVEKLRAAVSQEPGAGPTPATPTARRSP